MPKSTPILLAAVLALSVWGPQMLGEQARTVAQRSEAQAISRTDLVGRSIKAINYQHRSGATRIDFHGTPLLAGASGEAKVESKRGYLEIDAKFRGLQAARGLGSEYFTYVLWAITPEGRPENLGEVLLRGDRSDLKVTTQLQAFGLVVTAEPYFSVTQPSDVVVLENAVRSDTRGRVDEIEARYELLRRGQYVASEKPDELTAKLMVVDPNVPLQLYEARNAVRIARWVGAEKYAGETFNKAVDLLLQAEKYQARRRPEAKAAAMMARQAVQTAEDARLIAIQRQEEERLALERKAAAEREAAARAKAEAESQLRAKAEVDRNEADRLRSEAETLRQAAERDRLRAEEAAAEANRVRQSAEHAAALAEKQRIEAEQAKAAALADAERTRAEAKIAAEEAAAARAEAQAELNRVREDTKQELAKLEAARSAALSQKAAAESEAERSRRAAEEADRLREQSERERTELRQRLQTQLSRVLETTNTARGLIVNMADVLFDTAEYTLRSGAREKLARISGILAMQSDLKVEVEGHTDSVGGEAYNQKLSEQRAHVVRDYLIEQGIEPEAITARGFGKSRPKASNETPSGRQENRRVELVVSGAAIGTAENATR